MLLPRSTNTDDDVVSTHPATDPVIQNNQHHQGIDWIYGGWDRDIMQADVADNGPNPGDRLLDWSGAFNLYTHCNAAHGGSTCAASPSASGLSVRTPSICVAGS